MKLSRKREAIVPAEVSSLGQVPCRQAVSVSRTCVSQCAVTEENQLPLHFLRI